MYSAKGQQTKDHFIKTSAHLFNTKGYAGTSISDILNDAGYSKGALYRVFKDKDELAIAAFKYNYNIMKVQLLAAVENASSEVDRIFAIPRFYASMGTDVHFLEGGCPILNTSIEADDTHPQLKKMTRNAFTEMASLMEAAIIAAQANDAVKHDINPKEVSQFMVAAIEGSIAMTQSLETYKILKKNMNYLETAVKAML